MNKCTSFNKNEEMVIRKPAKKKKWKTEDSHHPKRIKESCKLSKKFNVKKLGGFPLFKTPAVNDWEFYLQNEKVEFYYRYRQKNFRKMNKNHFIFKKTIATGAFARVAFVKQKNTGLYFAIKVYEKKWLVKSNMEKFASNEIKVLQCSKFPFIMNCVHFFQDFTNLYYVMPFCGGGELFRLLKMYRALPEYMCVFYAAQIVLALEYLHYMDIIYRDLKPENIVIDHEGFIKLTDFTVCKFLYDNTRTFSLCGTPAYIAPEILTTSGYDKAVDFWTLGVFLYEINSGTTPFFHKDKLKIYKKIIECDYNMNTLFSFSLKNLISRLIRINPLERLGYQTGFEELKRHHWFHEIQWLQLFNKQCTPPYIPNLKSHKDLSYFGTYGTIMLKDPNPKCFREFIDYY